MSTEENSNNIETLTMNINTNDNNTKTNNESINEQNILISNEQKIKQLKQKLKILLQKTLGKNLLNLETNNQTQLQLLTMTTKSFKEFDNKIYLMKTQVEENIKKKEENKKLKKIKVQKAKFRSRTTQKTNIKKYDINNQSKIKDNNKNNESNKSLIKIRAKTTGKNDTRIQNSEKKTIKNKNMLIKVDTSNGLNNTLKLNKNNSKKFNLTEKCDNKTKNKINLDTTKNKFSSKNIKETKNSKDVTSTLRNNNSKLKINVIQKSQYNLKSNSNLLSNTKETAEKDKNSDKKLLINKRNLNIDYRKSFDYSNKKSSKQKSNNYVKKNTEIYSEKKSSSKKNLLNNPKNKNNKNNNIKTKTEEDTDTIIKSFEKQKEFLEKMRKQREENNLREEAKKKELEKEKEEERQREEERKKREMEIKKREEQRKKELEEEERKKDEERKQKQMEIEAKIQQEKIEKENIKKELEKQKQLEKQKKLEEEERIRKEKEKEEEERKKKEEMEKLEIEMDKMIEEEIKELPNNIELKIDNNDNNYLEENKNKEMNIQDLLELEEKNDQNFEYFHIKEEETKKEKPEIISEEQKDEEEGNININTNDNNKEDNINTPVVQYRKISILELIHDVKNFSPILFEFLSLKDLLEFTSISKKIKRQRIYIFNLQKKINLNNIGFEDMQSLNNKIKEYEENYSNNELNEPYIEFHLSRGAARAVQLLNNNTYSKIFRRPVLDNNLSQIYIAYKILLVFLGEINIAKISDDKLFWVKCTEYLNTNSENGKIGDYIMNKFEKYNCDCKTIFYIEKLMKGKKENISPSYYSKICGSTGLLIFLIKELLEYCGVIISTKKTQLSRIYQNLIFFKNIVDKLSEFNKTLESFNQ